MNASIAPMSLVTLQFGWGGLFDFEPIKGTYNICLYWGGQPRFTLCGRDMFADDAPGWSKGGGVSGPDVHLSPCRNCAQVAAIVFPELPISGMRENVAAFLALDPDLKKATPSWP